MSWVNCPIKSHLNFYMIGLLTYWEPKEGCISSTKEGRPPISIQLYWAGFLKCGQFHIYNITLCTWKLSPIITSNISNRCFKLGSLYLIHYTWHPRHDLPRKGRVSVQLCWSITNYDMHRKREQKEWINQQLDYILVSISGSVLL